MNSMRFLGIDYGEKRVGLALSDERGVLAFPKEILENKSGFWEKLGVIIKNEKIDEVIIGESFDFAGQPNKIQKEISEFVSKLKEELKIPVHMQKEFWTSVEARRYQDDGRKIDSSAAALILQRYLDKLNNK